MVMRKTGVILLGFLVGLFLTVASWPYLSYQADSPVASMTGNSIKEAIGTFYETSSVNQRIFILSQVFLLIIIIVVGFFIVRKFRKPEELFKKDYLIHDGKKRSRTDLDILYEMLKRRREVNMEDIERVFKVEPEIALGWSKVLENGELAEIDYPRFGKPVLRLIKKDNIEGAEEVMGYESRVEKVEDIKEEKVGNTKTVVTRKVIKKRSGKKKKVTKKKKVRKKIKKKVKEKTVKKKVRHSKKKR